MSKISWDEMNIATDTQQAFGTFHKHLIEMYNTHFPKISINGNITTESYGWLKIWKNSIKQKTKLYIKLKKVHSALNNDLYKKSCKRKLQQLMKDAENIIIMMCLLSIKILGCHKKYHWQEP